MKETKYQHSYYFHYIVPLDYLILSVFCKLSKFKLLFLSLSQRIFLPYHLPELDPRSMSFLEVQDLRQKGESKTWRSPGIFSYRPLTKKEIVHLILFLMFFSITTWLKHLAEIIMQRREVASPLHNILDKTKNIWTQLTDQYWWEDFSFTVLSSLLTQCKRLSSDSNPHDLQKDNHLASKQLAICSETLFSQTIVMQGAWAAGLKLPVLNGLECLGNTGCCK